MFQFGKKKRKIIAIDNKEGWSEDETQRANSQGNLSHAIKVATKQNHLENFEGAESFESYESAEQNYSERDVQNWTETYENYCHEEGLDNYESAEDLNRRRTRVARRMHGKYGRKGGIFAAHKLGQRHLGGHMGGIKGTLTMAITRVSYNIPFDLQCQLFNPLDGSVGNLLVNKYITPGVTFLGSTINPTNGSIVFTYALTSNLTVQDTVVVQCQEIPYALFQNAIMAGDIFQVGGGPPTKPGGQCSLSDASQAQIQFGKQWFFTHRNSLGTGQDKPLNAGMFIDASQFQLQYQNILIGFPIDKERGLIFTASFIPGYVPGQQLISTFFWNFSKVIMHNSESRGIRHFHA